MPSCTSGGVRVCSVCTVSEISSLTKQKTTTPKKRDRTGHDTTVYIHFKYRIRFVYERF